MQSAKIRSKHIVERYKAYTWKRRHIRGTKADMADHKAFPFSAQPAKQQQDELTEFLNRFKQRS